MSPLGWRCGLYLYFACCLSQIANRTGPAIGIHPSTLWMFRPSLRKFSLVHSVLGSSSSSSSRSNGAARSSQRKGAYLVNVWSRIRSVFSRAVLRLSSVRPSVSSRPVPAGRFDRSVFVAIPNLHCYCLWERRAHRQKCVRVVAKLVSLNRTAEPGDKGNSANLGSYG